jgi:uncharacterized membrane protein YkvA (DUF1232 family)
VPLSIKFDLSDQDLDHFRKLMVQTRENVKGRTQEQVVAAARSLLENARASSAPEFVLGRLGRLTKLIEMLEDEEWQLPEDERAHVLTALAYFCEPCDLIPDHLTALGFLDDAIMIELVVEELRGELEAYEDFCRFREEQQAHHRAERGSADDDSEHTSTITRADWLDAKRAELHGRMREHGLSRGLRGLFSLFSS